MDIHPKHSMYGIFTYMKTVQIHQFVGKHTIHRVSWNGIGIHGSSPTRLDWDSVDIYIHGTYISLASLALGYIHSMILVDQELDFP